MYTPQEMVYRTVINQAETNSLFSKYTQILTRLGAKWAWDVTLPEVTPDELSEIEAFFTRLNGKEHWIAFFDWMYPVARGTINLSGVTNNGVISQFAETAVLAGCGNTRTLLSGSWLKLGTQVVRTVLDATSDAGGAMNIEFRHRTRAQISTGQAVVLDHPVSNYILESSNFESIRQSGFAQKAPKVSLVEIF